MPSRLSDAEVDWSEIHSREQSWRGRLLGDLASRFAVPRCTELFLDAFGEDRQLDFLEVGAGNGEVPVHIMQSRPECIRSYSSSELFLEGAHWLRSQGLTSCVADAQHLPFSDNAFDAVVSFDVLHHVSDPQRMADEMVRVSRGRLLLTESNGLSVGRKLMELTPGHRRAGERSYAPWDYRRFFEHSDCRLVHTSVKPFLFPLPGGVPRSLLRPFIAFNRVVERVPFLRWQCSNVCISITFEK